MRKHGLTRTFRATELPLWKRDIPRRISVGDNVLTIMAEAQHYQPVSVTFPEENPAITAAELDLVDDDAVSQHLVSQLPVADLLIWL